MSIKAKINGLRTFIDVMSATLALMGWPGDERSHGAHEDHGMSS